MRKGSLDRPTLEVLSKPMCCLTGNNQGHTPMEVGLVIVATGVWRGADRLGRDYNAARGTRKEPFVGYSG